MPNFTAVDNEVLMLIYKLMFIYKTTDRSPQTKTAVRNSASAQYPSPGLKSTTHVAFETLRSVGTSSQGKTVQNTILPWQDKIL